MWNEELKDWDDAWKGFIHALKTEPHKGRILFMGLNRIPNWIAPFNYYKCIQKYGKETWWNPANLWRQLFHLGPALLFGLFVFLPLWALPTLIAFFFTLPREWEDAGHDFRNITIKNILDLLVWTGGAALGTWGIYVWN